MVRALGAALGPDWEVVLHDVSGGDHAIVALENGGLTGRGEDAPLTDFGAYLLRTQGDTDLETLANYASAAPDGRPLRSSVALIRDDQRRIVPTFARPGGFEAMAWGGHPHKPGAGGAPQWSPSRFCGNSQE